LGGARERALRWPMACELVLEEDRETGVLSVRVGRGYAFLIFT
jgi:hypothetical protein